MAAEDTGSSGNEDLKAKMREALERKQGTARGVDHPAGSREKTHGPEVRGSGGPKMHRRKAGGS